MTEKITYGRLYSDMVKLFAVKQDGKDDVCLGDYMRGRASECKRIETERAQKLLEKRERSNLPVAVKKQNETHAITALFTYVNERLTVKQAPVRDKTIRRFPLRTVLSSAFCAFIMCAVMVCYGVIGTRGGDTSSIVNEPKYEFSEEYTDTLGYDEYNDIF
ncbi:MAG: hypothetical protein J6L90_00965 [Clostridia bacterium]|nr:hypothetical protein [Clostridia bacterium]